MLKILKSEDKEKLRDYFGSKENILLAIIFGSYNTEFQRENSDLDFAILFEKNVSLMEEMELLKDLSRILSFENVDLTNLNKAPISLQFEALKGEIIYEKDDEKTSDFMEYVFKRYADFVPVMRAFEQDFLEGSFVLDE